MNYQVIGRGVRRNNFKKLYTASVTVLDGDHVVLGSIIEGKLKKEVEQDYQKELTKLTDKYS